MQRAVENARLRKVCVRQIEQPFKHLLECPTVYLGDVQIKMAVVWELNVVTN
jgi:hypothetical protein